MISSICRKAIKRPSKIWMRRLILSKSNWLRLLTTFSLNSIHSLRILTKPFCAGLPSVSIITMFTGQETSMLVCTSKNAINSSLGILLVLGSRIRRTSFLPSLFTESSMLKTDCLINNWSWSMVFLSFFGLGLEMASISAMTVSTETPCGNSLMIMRHWPRAIGSSTHLARNLSEPRPVS